MKSISMALALLVMPAAAETLTNADVVTLVQAGIGDDAVIAKIRASANRFDVSTDQIVALKRKGVPSGVIAAMIGANADGPAVKAVASADSSDPRAPHPSGVYLMADGPDMPRMTRIDPISANQTKTGGILGYALTGGIASLNMKSVIPDAVARTRSSDGRPVFYFYFDEAQQSLSNGGNANAWATGPAAPVTSPNEFSLVRFDVKANRREARVGSYNIAGAKSGVMDKDRIPFAYEQVAPGIYKVTPSQLKPGEYGFLYSMRAGSGPGMLGAGIMTARVFDFSVAP